MTDEAGDNEARRVQLEATLAERGVETYFARGYFKGKGTEQEIYRDDGVHLNPKGHHVYAEFIEDKLREDSLRFRQWATGAPSPPAARRSGSGDDTRPAVETP